MLMCEITYLITIFKKIKRECKLSCDHGQHALDKHDSDTRRLPSVACALRAHYSWCMSFEYAYSANWPGFRNMHGD